HRLLLDRLLVDQVEALAHAVAGIVAFGQAPDLRLARALEVQHARHLARRALLDLGDAEGDLAPDLHQARRDLLDHAVDRRPIALAAGRHAVDAALHDPDIALPGHGDVTGLGAFHLGIAAPDDLARVGEELRLGVRGDLGAVDLGNARRQRRAEPGGRRALLHGRRLGRRRRRIVRRRRLRLLLLGGGGAGQQDKNQDEKSIHYLRALTSGLAATLLLPPTLRWNSRRRGGDRRGSRRVLAAQRGFGAPRGAAA